MRSYRYIYIGSATNFAIEQLPTPYFPFSTSLSELNVLQLSSVTLLIVPKSGPD